ncbi:hypothetical protein ACU4HD_23660 [Cupriavidus basilensis]
MLRDDFLKPRREQAHLDFLEGDAGMLHQQPGAQRPGRVVLVADDELHREILAGNMGESEAGANRHAMERAGQRAGERTIVASRAEPLKANYARSNVKPGHKRAAWPGA